MGAVDYDYDAFATYATDPDRDLIRAVEVFVEGFHRRTTLPDKLKRKLELCVDGRDFKIPRRSRETGRLQDVADIVESYLKRSRALIVFCGPLSRFHPWINHEVRWWLENRPGAPVYFALTHGRRTMPEEVMPPALLAAGGGDLAIYFDLRGYHQDRPFTSVLRLAVAARRRSALLRSPSGRGRIRSFREEAVRLTARLLSDASGGDLSVGEVEAAWEPEETWRRFRSRAIASAFVAAVVGGAYATWTQADARKAAEVQAKAEAWLQRSRMLTDEGGTALPSALAYAASALHLSPNARAIEAGILASQGIVPIEKVLTPGGGDPAWTATYLGDTGLLAAGGRSGVLRLVEKNTGDVRAELDLKGSAIRSLAYDGARRALVVGTDRGLVRLSVRWDGSSVGLVEDGRHLRGSRVDAVALDAARGRVLAGLNQQAEIWGFPIDAATTAPGVRLARVMDPRFAEHGVSEVPSSVYGLAVRGDRLIATGIDGIISVFDLADEGLGEPRQAAHPRSIYAMAATRRGDEVAVADSEGGLSVYGIEDLRLRRAETRPTAAASVGRNLDGNLSTSAPQSSADVGVALSGDEGTIAVTSHDRSVRFLTYSDLAPLGSAVHRAAPRGVLFEPYAERALTLSDDGSMQVVRPMALAETYRLAGIGGFAAGEGGLLVAWPERRRRAPGPGRVGPREEWTPVFAVDPEDGSRPHRIGSIPAEPARGILQEGIAGIANWGSTKVRLFPLQDQPRTCDLLQHPNSEQSVDLVRALGKGPAPGTLSTHSVPNGSSSWWLTIWNLVSCRANERWKGTVQGATSDGAWVTAPEHGTVTVGRPGGSSRSLVFGGGVEGLALARGGDALLVRLAAGIACVCTVGRSAVESAMGACAVRSADYDRRLGDGERVDSRAHLPLGPVCAARLCVPPGADRIIRGRPPPPAGRARQTARAGAALRLQPRRGPARGSCRRDGSEDLRPRDGAADRRPADAEPGVDDRILFGEFRGGAARDVGRFHPEGLGLDAGQRAETDLPPLELIDRGQDLTRRPGPDPAWRDLRPVSASGRVEADMHPRCVHRG